jgi:hypothetical protein
MSVVGYGTAMVVRRMLLGKHKENILLKKSTEVISPCNPTMRIIVPILTCCSF